MSNTYETEFIMNTLNNHKQLINDLLNKSIEFQKYFPFIKVFPDKTMEHSKAISAIEYDLKFKYGWLI